ncbi:hypothetical protein GQR58_030579 [Nymphon striatum]|nr:hypothetical protein GQR58_030579 [Nymphon striatum]
MVTFAQTKIYPLFALLFGYGLALQVANADRDGTDLWPRYRRRMWGLVLLGVMHGIFFFPGDILVIYAAIGAVAYRLRGLEARSLVRISVSVYGASALVWLLIGGIDALSWAGSNTEVDADVFATLSEGSFAEVVSLQFFYWLVTLAILTVVQGPAVFACFLAGIALGRTTLLSDPQAHRDLAKRVLRWMPLGVAGAGVGATMTVDAGRWETMGFAVGYTAAPIVAAGYLAALAVLLLRWPALSRTLEAPGRIQWRAGRPDDNASDTDGIAGRSPPLGVEECEKHREFPYTRTWAQDINVIVDALERDGYYIESGAEASDSELSSVIRRADSSGATWYFVALADSVQEGFEDEIYESVSPQGNVVVHFFDRDGFDNLWLSSDMSQSEADRLVDASFDAGWNGPADLFNNMVTAFSATSTTTSGSSGSSSSGGSTSSSSGGGGFPWALLAIPAPDAVQHYREATDTYLTISDELPDVDKLEDADLEELAELGSRISHARWQMDAAEAIMDGEPLPEKPKVPPPPAPPKPPAPREQQRQLKAEAAMDPEIEIEQAIDEARKQDRQLRNQAAKVIAHREQLESRIEKSADQVGEAREMAKQALLRAERAKVEEDSAGLEKWTNTASSLAMKLQASESNLESLKGQYEIAVAQADEANSAVQANAMRVQELAAKRMQLLGQIQQAKMQEEVNKAVEAMSGALETDAPSLERVEGKIEARLAEAKAHAEIAQSTPEGAEAELREAVSLAKADDKLAELRSVARHLMSDRLGQVPESEELLVRLGSPNHHHNPHANANATTTTGNRLCPPCPSAFWIRLGHRFRGCDKQVHNVRD